MRGMTDIGQLFFITDDTRIKGNRAYYAGKYYDAIDAYEQVLGCYLWLEPTSSQSEFEEIVFKKFEFRGITDGMVRVREKEVVRQDDKEIETETSKLNY